MRKFKIGLALGGGGARGIAHIGVLKVLEKNKLTPDFVSGTSMGAIVGAMYCCGMSVEEMEKKVSDFLYTDIYKNLKFDSLSKGDSKDFLRNTLGIIKEKAMFFLSGLKIAFLEKSAIDSMLEYFLPDIDFVDLKIPLACVATDIAQGEEFVIKEGSILEAVSCSMSIPGIMPPVKYKNHMLVDGGAVRLVPTKVVKDMGCDFAIGVDVSTGLHSITENELRNAADINYRTNDIVLCTLRRLQLKDADFLLFPDVKNIKWFEVKRFKECLLAGENQAESKVSELKKAINIRSSKTLLKRIFCKP
jgi:NTE family protein